MSAESSDRMPPEYLWTATARAAYERMSADAPYGLMRRNPASELVRDCAYERVLCLGAGPNACSEVAVLDAMRCAPAQVVVHDIDGASAQAAQSQMEQLAARPVRYAVAHGELRSGCVSFGGDFQLATLLGYTLGNLTDTESASLLRCLSTAARQLLLDVPTAWCGDPRLRAGTFDSNAESSWLRAAYFSWRGVEPSSIESDVQSALDGYLVRVLADGEYELIRFRRRSASGWIALCEQNGFVLRRAAVTDGYPRLALLLDSVKFDQNDRKKCGTSE